MSDTDPPDTLSPAAQAAVDTATLLVGLTAPDPAYLALVDPNDDPAHQRVVAKESDCGLVWLGLTEQLYAVADRAAYVEGSAFALVWARAQGAPWSLKGAVRRPTIERPPEVGDALFYDAAGTPGGAPAHIDACVTSVRNEYGYYKITAVAGGQRDAAGRETILVMARTLHWIGLRLVDVATGRPVNVAISADEMARIYGSR